jgi:hypothetical protein
MRAAPGEVLHFSEDPTISRFVPHVADTATDPKPYVWAVDAERCPDYWFPRQCPRAMAWVVPTTTPEDRLRILGPGGGNRVHAIEYGWLSAISTARLYAYRFSAADFRPQGEPVFAHVADREVTPLGPPTPVGDLWEVHRKAGIQVRVLPSLHDFWAEVVTSTLGWSGVRLRNARR